MRNLAAEKASRDLTGLPLGTVRLSILEISAPRRIALQCPKAVVSLRWVVSATCLYPAQSRDLRRTPMTMLDRRDLGELRPHLLHVGAAPTTASRRQSPSRGSRCAAGIERIRPRCHANVPGKASHASRELGYLCLATDAPLASLSRPLGDPILSRAASQTGVDEDVMPGWAPHGASGLAVSGRRGGGVSQPRSR